MTSASVPLGESILVPPDQRFKEVQCYACLSTHRTETRFKGLYTCTKCQWLGLTPVKQPESVIHRVEIEEKMGKKKRSEVVHLDTPMEPMPIATKEELEALARAHEVDTPMEDGHGPSAHCPEGWVQTFDTARATVTYTASAPLL